jgi:glycosyltransferase involved in cell wall biosynthesis
MLKPMVSVVTASYNASEYIEDCIKSTLKQTYFPLEHLIVNDGSTDGTEDILKRYDGYIRYVNQENAGWVRAYNKGIMLAKGNFVCLMNSDDYFHDEYVVEDAMKLVEDGVDLVFGDVAIVDEKGKLIRDCFGDGAKYSLKRLICSRTVLPQGSTFFRREAAIKSGLLDASMRGSEESLLWMKIALNGDIKYVPKTLSCYRLNPNQESRKNRWGFRKLLVDKFFEYYGEHAELRKQALEGAIDWEIWKNIDFNYPSLLKWYARFTKYAPTTWIYPIIRKACMEMFW